MDRTQAPERLMAAARRHRSPSTSSSPRPSCCRPWSRRPGVGAASVLGGQGEVVLSVPWLPVAAIAAV